MPSQSLSCLQPDVFAGAQLLYNLIICDYLKFLGKYFIGRPCFVMYQLSLLYSTINAVSVITAVAVSTQQSALAASVSYKYS